MMMIQPASKKKITALLLLAGVLTLLFSFLGAPLLRVLRQTGGATLYWFIGISFSALLMLSLGPLAFVVLGIWVCLGLYAELEDRGRANLSSAFWSVFLGTAVATLGPLVYSHYAGINLNEVLQESLSTVLKQLPAGSENTTWLSGVSIDADFLIGQLPSMLMLLVLSSLAFALMLDRRFALFAGLRFERTAAGIRLLEFQMPDWSIWVVMISFLLSFLKTGIPRVSMISLNIFNVMMGAYFFQGLAILESAFRTFRVGAFVRMIIYVFVVGQLFFLLSLIGVIDYWVDFRRRMGGIFSSEPKQKNGENV